VKVLAVDDERPALEDLGRLLEGCPQVDGVTLADGGHEALRFLADGRRYGAVFLDVRMPGVDGLELAGLLGRFADPPALIFVSAFEDGAVGAFQNDLHPVDYLMKPVSRGRVEEALARVASTRVRPADPGQSRAVSDDEIIPIANQHGGSTRLLPRSSVLFLKAEGDYVRIHTDSERFLVRAALGDIEQRWEPYGFVRVHRSYLANLRRASEICPELGGGATVVFEDGSVVPVARRHVAELRRRLRS
jgi:DNA-binding LytR/AlgR family response regulator